MNGMQCATTDFPKSKKGLHILTKFRYVQTLFVEILWETTCSRLLVILWSGSGMIIKKQTPEGKTWESIQGPFCFLSRI